MDITLNTTTIKQAVKDDTYITSLIDKSADLVKNAPLAYNEAAGDEAYHNRKLDRTLLAAVKRFEAAVIDFASADNFSISDSTSGGNIIIHIDDNSRMPDIDDVITTLTEEYVINMMLYIWWQTIKPTLAKDYHDLAVETFAHVRLLLIKKAPTATTTPYTATTGTTT